MSTTTNCVPVSSCYGVCVSACGGEGYCVCSTGSQASPSPTTSSATSIDISSIVNMVVQIIPLIIIIQLMKDFGGGGCQGGSR